VVGVDVAVEVEVGASRAGPAHAGSLAAAVSAP
jgi:hypothetical protein